MLLLSALAWSAPCDLAAPHLIVAQLAVLEADLEATEQALGDVERAWSCAGEPAPVSEWQRYALVRATMLHYRGEADAEPWFAIASPLGAEDVFGPTIQERTARARPIGLLTKLLVLPPLPPQQVFVDGQSYDGGALEMGPHLVQLTDPIVDRVAHGVVLDLRDDVLVRHEVLAPEAMQTASPTKAPRPGRARRATGWGMAGAGAVLVTAGVLGSRDARRDLASGELSTADAIRSTDSKNRRFAFAGYTGMGLTGIGLLLALPL